MAGAEIVGAAPAAGAVWVMDPARAVADGADGAGEAVAGAAPVGDPVEGDGKNVGAGSADGRQAANPLSNRNETANKMIARRIRTPG